MKAAVVWAVIIAALGVVRPASAEMAVIVNKDNPLAAISKTEIEMIYLGKKKLFDGGMVAVPVDLPAESAVRQEFFANVLGKDGESYRLYWVRMIFSGKGQPPVTLKSEEDAVRFVSGNKGGIAFVDSVGITPGVKVIPISGKK